MLHCFNLSYSIKKFVEDLQQVVAEVVVPINSSFHLFGHSFGGVLAFEFLRSYLNHDNLLDSLPFCRSVILSNTPTNLQQCNQDYDCLFARDPLQFWKKHACNIGIPPSLQDAMKNAGTVWTGMDVVADYRARPLSLGDQSNKDLETPQLLILSCTRDFAYPTSNEVAWREVIPMSYMNQTQFVNFDDCSHYPFYEDEASYGRTLRDFFSYVEGQTQMNESRRNSDFGRI
jgi:pimeloyl-ACP methyl ester carboxylesterase